MGIVKRQSFPATVATYAGVFIGYVNFFLLYPNILSPEQLGLIRVLLAATAIFSQIALLGMSFVLLRFFPFYADEKNRHNGIFAYSLRNALSGFIVVSLLAIIFRQQITGYFAERSALFVDYYWHLFPIALCLVLFELFFFYTRALVKIVVPIFIKEVLLRLFQTGCIILFYYGVLDFEMFIGLFVAAYFLHLLCLMGYVMFLKQFFVSGKLNASAAAPLKHLRRYGWFVFAAGIASTYTLNIDTIMLGAMAGLASTAIYSIAFFVGTFIQIPGRTINQVAIPLVTEAWKNHDMKKLQELYRQTSLNEFIIGGFLLLMIWINADLLLSFLPATYAASKYVILIVGLGKLFDLFTGINGEIILFSKHVKFNLATNLLLIAVATLSNYFLIPVLGVMGSAWASVITMVCYNTIRIFFLQYKYQIQPFTLKTLFTLLLLIASFGVFYLSPSTGNLWADGIYKTVLIGGIFGVCVLAFRVSDEINQTWQSVLKRVWK